jgi:anti-sigma factor RsiW
MKNHTDYNVMIQLFIDDELKGQEREDLISHLKDCASCQEELEEAKAFSARVRGARLQVEAPPALRVVRPHWRSLAAVAMLLIAVAGVLSISYLRREVSAGSFVDAAVAEHRGVAMVGSSMCNLVRQMSLPRGLRTESRSRFECLMRASRLMTGRSTPLLGGAS